MGDTDTDIPSKIGDYSSSGSDDTYRASKSSIGTKSNDPSALYVPISIFNQELSGLEALSYYLKEHAGLRFCVIASLLNRDDRTIWDSYTQGKKKALSFSNTTSTFHIPLYIFEDRNLGVLEALSKYLKEERALKFSQIAKLLGKNDRTIWTAYHRAQKKRSQVNHAS